MNLQRAIRILRFCALSLVLLGLIVLIIFSFKILDNFGLSAISELNLSNDGLIGDYIGGVIGTIFSFTGTLLFAITLIYQSMELQNSNRNNRLQFTQQQFLTFINQRNIFIINIEYDTRDY